MTKLNLALLVFMGLLLSACGPDSPTIESNAQPTPTIPVTYDPKMPDRTNQIPLITQAGTELIEKLKGQGISISYRGLDDSFTLVTQVRATIFQVNQDTISFFEFPDSEAAKAIIVTPEGATLRNSKGATIAYSPAKIGPHVYRKDNIVVLYIGSDEAVIKALSAIMGNQIAGV